MIGLQGRGSFPGLPPVRRLNGPRLRQLNLFKFTVVRVVAVNR